MSESPELYQHIGERAFTYLTTEGPRAMLQKAAEILPTAILVLVVMISLWVAFVFVTKSALTHPPTPEA